MTSDQANERITFAILFVLLLIAFLLVILYYKGVICQGAPLPVIIRPEDDIVSTEERSTVKKIMIIESSQESELDRAP